MARSRLTQALEEGAVSLPEGGDVVVVGPSADFDLSALDPSRVRIVQGFRPDYEAWEARGYAVSPTMTGADAAVVVVPRARAAALRRIALAAGAVPPGAPVLVDGQKDNGIDGVLKALRREVDLSAPFSKAHGKIAGFAAGPLPPEWGAGTQSAEGFVTAPGAFSADAVDAGSAALAAVLPPLKGRVADLGAGWGYLAMQVLKGDDVTALDLVEADHDALLAARANVADPRAAFHWADATAFGVRGTYDAVISNPPFHTSRRADPGLGRAFVRTAARLLKPSGAFFMVANRHLPYEAALNEAFEEVREIPGPPAFKLICATKPRARRKTRIVSRA